MIIERAASEDEMVLEFLRAEVGSVIGPDADLNNPHENAMRARVLDSVRGYASRQYIFRNFPTDVAWERVGLTTADFPNLRYVDSSPWRQLAGEGLRVTVGAKHIGDGTFDKTNVELLTRAPKIVGIARAVHDGIDLPPIILAQAADELIVLEGNHRVTGFVLAQTNRPMYALLGSSASMHKWAKESWQ